MTKKLEHLLLKHGILKSLSIAKKPNSDNIKNLMEQIKPIAKNKIDFNNKMREAIEKEITESLLNNDIPGIIVNNSLARPTVAKNTVKPTPPSLIPDKSKPLVYKTNKERLAELYTLASQFNREALHNKLTKNDVCFTIYVILSFLEISQDDFKNFHNDLTASNEKPEEPTDDEDDDDDDTNEGDSK
jgi:hypothetical protein